MPEYVYAPVCLYVCEVVLDFESEEILVERGVQVGDTNVVTMVNVRLKERECSKWRRPQV